MLDPMRLMQDWRKWLYAPVTRDGFNTPLMLVRVQHLAPKPRPNERDTYVGLTDLKVIYIGERRSWRVEAVCKIVAPALNESESHLPYHNYIIFY